MRERSGGDFASRKADAPIPHVAETNNNLRAMTGDGVGTRGRGEARPEVAHGLLDELEESNRVPNAEDERMSLPKPKMIVAPKPPPPPPRAPQRLAPEVLENDDAVTSIMAHAMMPSSVRPPLSARASAHSLSLPAPTSMRSAPPASSRPVGTPPLPRLQSPQPPKVEIADREANARPRPLIRATQPTLRIPLSAARLKNADARTAPVVESRAQVSRWWAGALLVTGLVGGTIGGAVARVDVSPLQRASHAFFSALAGGKTDGPLGDNAIASSAQLAGPLTPPPPPQADPQVAPAYAPHQAYPQPVSTTPQGSPQVAQYAPQSPSTQPYPAPAAPAPQPPTFAVTQLPVAQSTNDAHSRAAAPPVWTKRAPTPAPQAPAVTEPKSPQAQPASLAQSKSMNREDDEVRKAIALKSMLDRQLKDSM